MKKKLILLVLVVVIAAGAGLVLPNKISKSRNQYGGCKIQDR